MPSDGKSSLCLWQGELKIPYIPQKPVLMRNLFKCEVYKYQKKQKNNPMFRSNPELKSATFQIQNIFPKIEGLLQSKPCHIFRINYHIALICEYSNMTSFIGYVNNAVIKLPIYFNSHMCIDEHHSLAFDCLTV